MQPESYYISRYRQLIEKKIGWGSSDNWQSQDFENLSEKIFDETKVMLSSSTLKRIWGKVKYDSSPNRATLDALAVFAGYTNWRDFINNIDIPPVETPVAPEKIEEPVVVKPSKKTSYKIIVPVVAMLVIAALVVFGFMKKDGLNFKEVSFSSKAVAVGVPNTVIFNYDALHSNADSVFIQQSWDKRKKYSVDKQLHDFASTYYYPGYYKAKLILNDSIVKEHDVYIETNGWIGIIEKQPVPAYLPASLFKNQLGITADQLSEYKIDYKKEAPVFSLTKVDKSMQVDGNNLLFTATIQNTYKESNGVCQFTNILIMGTNGVIAVPLCKAGCVGEIGLMLGMKYIDGKTHDLSGFGVDFSKPVKFTCQTGEQQIIFSVNDKVVYKGDYKEGIGSVVGMQFKFNGTGMVSNVEIGNN